MKAVSSSYTNLDSCQDVATGDCTNWQSGQVKQILDQFRVYTTNLQYFTHFKQNIPY